MTLLQGGDSSLDDCVYHLICPCCTLCQESRTLEMNNVQDGTWHGRAVTQYASGVTVKAAKHSLSCTHLLLSRPNPLNPAACKKVQTAMSGHKLQKSVFSHMDPTIPTSAASVNYVYSRFVGWGILCRLHFINMCVLRVTRIGSIEHLLPGSWRAAFLGWEWWAL
ncbi:hypothetical protein CK203_079443 [Vitis vinifera]|uniref:PLAC8 family protein n=1 Tax=Vitis vinifera TaxID=29760 RepID=A0A438BS90_VITVI|nr:hypothetical protein CK203_079443 [Vitis vinifera]